MEHYVGFVGSPTIVVEGDKFNINQEEEPNIYIRENRVLSLPTNAILDFSSHGMSTRGPLDSLSSCLAGEVRRGSASTVTFNESRKCRSWDDETVYTVS